MFTRHPTDTAQRSRHPGLPRLVAISVWAGLALLMAGCRSPAQMPAGNSHDPGWVVKQGQAVWRPDAAAEELTGELVLATHPDGRAFAQFAKPPVTLVLSSCSGDHWRVQLPLRRDVLRGRGEPQPPLAWVEILHLQLGAEPGPGWLSTPQADGAWRLENEHTGEVLEGFLNP